MVRVKINNNDWFINKKEDIWIASKGYFYLDNKYLSEKSINDLLLKLIESEDENKFLEFLKSVNGFFAFIIKTKEKLYCVVDRVRSIPLFYNYGVNEITIYDNLDFDSKNINKIAALEFLLTGYVTGDQTLLDSYFQLEAGTFLLFEIQKNKLKVEKYYEYLSNELDNRNEEELKEELKDILYKIFNRLYNSIKNKNVIVPLSGGFDSRLIVTMLKEFGMDNVKCFTYGRQANKESEKSKEIARLLGYKWDFYEYNYNDWKIFSNSEDLKLYKRKAFNFVSVPHIQDFMAVKQIYNEEVNQEIVFIPGHSGDFLAGSHITTNIYKGYIENVLDCVVNEIFERHYYLWTIWNNNIVNEIKNKIKINIPKLNSMDKREEAAKVFEYWDWKERQSKFIINSLRVYEHFNYSWMIPLWDLEIMEFFNKIPIEYKYNKYLYDETLNYMFPKLFEKRHPRKIDGISIKKKLYKNRIIRYISQVRIAKKKHHLQWYGLFAHEKLGFIYDILETKLLWPNSINSYYSLKIIKELLETETNYRRQILMED